MARPSIEQADAARVRLERIRAALDKEIVRLLAKLKTEDGALVSTRDALKTATQVRRQLVEVVKRKGVELIKDEAAERALLAAERTVRDVDLREFAPDMEESIERLVDGRLDEVAEAFGNIDREIKRALDVSIANERELSKAIAAVADRVGASFAQAQAAVDTAIMGSGRAVTVDATETAQEETGEVWVMRYVGPRDSIVRDFCSRLVGKAVRVDEVDGLDNGQGLPVREFGGGYNCRHVWVPMRLADARRRGIVVVRP